MTTDEMIEKYLEIQRSALAPLGVEPEVLDRHISSINQIMRALVILAKSEYQLNMQQDFNQAQNAIYGKH